MPVRHLKTAASAASNQTAPNVVSIVKEVIENIRSNGDKTVRTYSEKFDKWSPKSFKLSEAEIKAALAKVPKQTIEDIKVVQQNVRTFALAQRRSISDFELEIQPGVHLGQKNVPVGSVGAYIPGGRYPLLASAHMTSKSIVYHPYFQMGLMYEMRHCSKKCLCGVSILNLSK